MSWATPDLGHLVADRLERARAELAEDPRLVAAGEGAAEAPPAFLAELIEKKLAAAWQSGVEALEASLRLDAADALLEVGCDFDAVRDQLDRAGEALTAPPPARRRPAAGWAMPPLAASSLVFLAATLLVTALWVAYGFHPVLLVLGVAAGFGPAWAVHGLAARRAASACRQLVSEYPGVLVRLYVAACEERMAAYGQTVRALWPAHAALALPYEAPGAKTGAC